ncbi:diguanylate cyclase [Fredinandcohnia sp. 179-A 10B2 NHS]|uniref:diguanylate cyclase n=1 Tax=Fredinandcohnia sp. 179-A 10B2 NHS TaxID=3235176 RepID=UPI0039A0BAFD
MHLILDTFLENMTLIIAFMYAALKTKEFLIGKVKKMAYITWLAPLAISLLSVLVMHHPLSIEGMRVDLRGVPIFFIAYLGGWRLGIIALLLPTWYRYGLGGPTVTQGIIQAIFIPYIIGSFFHKKSSYNPPYTIIYFKQMMKAFLIYQIIRLVLMLWSTPITLDTALIMTSFEIVAVICIGLIQNDTNRNLLSKKELEFQSRHDTLTSLYNIRHFRNKVGEFSSQEKPFYVAMFDVDYFKNYNDTHGHPGGDSVLRIIGQLLEKNVRSEDIYARYGGEEFIICFPTNNITTAIEMAEQFRKSVEEYRFFGEEAQPNGTLTISIGISGQSQTKNLDELIEEADQSLYQAKHGGRNNIKTFR